MKLVVVAVTSPPSQLAGYLRRFLQEPLTGVFVGGVTADMIEDVQNQLTTSAASGVMAVATGRSECGFHIAYFKAEKRCLVDFDGLQLVEKQKSDKGETVV